MGMEGEKSGCMAVLCVHGEVDEIAMNVFSRIRKVFVFNVWIIT